MTNTELLSTSPGELEGMDKQRQHILVVASLPLPCAWCEQPVSQIDALGGDPELWVWAGQVGTPNEERYQCPHCTAPLRLALTLIGGERAWVRCPLTVNRFQAVVDQLVQRGIVLVRHLPTVQAAFREPTMSTAIVTGQRPVWLKTVDALAVRVPDEWQPCDHCEGLHASDACPGRGAHVGDSGKGDADADD